MFSTNMEWSIQERLKIIKDFRPYPKPIFVGNEDLIHGVTWGLYNRVCENIKSFTILFENQQYCDAFIIAGVALETCAKLSFIKDRDNLENSKKAYNQYLASTTLSRLKYNLNLDKDLSSELSWANFTHLLKIFYPVGNSIFINKKETYENVIKTINFRLGYNKDKISLLKKSFKELPTNRYIDFFYEKLKIYDESQEIAQYFSRCYSQYCEFKHGNMMTPGVFFEGDDDSQNKAIRNNIADEMLYLILGLILYLERYSSKPFI